MREKGERGKKTKGGKKREGDGFRGVSGAWVLRRAGPHTNNARST